MNKYHKYLHLPYLSMFEFICKKSTFNYLYYFDVKLIWYDQNTLYFIYFIFKFCKYLYLSMYVYVCVKIYYI